jgi:N-acetylmuramoyl-L-alanine amidase
VLLAVCIPAVLGISRPPGLSDVADVRYWSYPHYTRVVIELSRFVQTGVERLPRDPKAKLPERLYLDLPEVWVGKRFTDAIRVSDGLLRGIRLGQNTLRNTRVVLDLERYRSHRLLLLDAPPRVVVDVYGRRSPSRDATARGAARPLPIQARPVHTVVLDPGHGGRDPGAIAPTGLREKDAMLRLARALRPRLEARGFRVVLTREGDQTLELEERTAIAEGSGGDLFLSLHANAAPRRKLRGIETYYLDKSHQRHTVRLAAHENGITAAQLDILQRTVASFRISEVSKHSARLATMVHGEVVRGLQRRFGRVEDLGVKKGPFFVLFLANMPSILIEVGFLTNRDEARRLADPNYLTAVADEIAEGVARYREATTPRIADRRP